MKPIKKRSLSTESVVDVYRGNILEEAYLSFNQMQKELRMLEQDYFNSYSELSEMIEKLIKKDKITKFLYSGPTNHALIIPSNIQSSLKNIQLNFDEQASAIKFSIQITNDSLKKLRVDNWFKNSRLVWGYFLTSPSKIEELFKQRYEEIKAKETRCVRFKE
ncbi:hypothetical protein WA026_022045 [Henosepilachna vigintioctopunctata]|uniref:Uncharacterized protein n=1 Tax=Henosepilachna vigintioctopunctata TaxID=420089 RepID=A0AAW1UCH9_9CUCU